MDFLWIWTCRVCVVTRSYVGSFIHIFASRWKPNVFDAMLFIIFMYAGTYTVGWRWGKNFHINLHTVEISRCTILHASGNEIKSSLNGFEYVDPSPCFQQRTLVWPTYPPLGSRTSHLTKTPMVYEIIVDYPDSQHRINSLTFCEEILIDSLISNPILWINLSPDPSPKLSVGQIQLVFAEFQ